MQPQKLKEQEDTGSNCSISLSVFTKATAAKLEVRNKGILKGLRVAKSMGRNLSFSGGLSLEFQTFLAILQFISWSCKIFRRTMLSFGDGSESRRACAPCSPWGCSPLCCFAPSWGGGPCWSPVNPESTGNPGLCPGRRGHRDISG